MLVKINTTMVITYGMVFISSVCAKDTLIYAAEIYSPPKIKEPRMESAGRHSVKITSATDSQPKPSRMYSQLPPIYSIMVK